MLNTNDTVKENLVQAVKEIETKSSAEIVALIKTRSGTYNDIALWTGFATLFIVFTFLMFSPFDFNVYLIYILSILAFFVGYAKVRIFDFLCFFFTPKKRLAHNAEVYARAVFQKGGIRHTTAKTGVLFYMSKFEKQVMILADRGVQNTIPAEEWEKINTSFKNIFVTKNPEEKFIEELKNCASVFAQYLPIQPDDVNELPDNLDIEI
jgi:putative membrane protein